MAESDGNQQAATPPPAPAQTPGKMRYGSWMLVTKKSRPAPVENRNRQSKKDGNLAANRGNQFSVLGDMQGPDAPSAHRNRSDKSKSRPGPMQSNKGKSPLPSNTPLANPPAHHNAVTPSHNGNVQPPIPASRGRGGRTSAPRGNGRGVGRGSRQDHTHNGVNPTTVGGNGQAGVQGVFQFGKSPFSSGIGAGKKLAKKKRREVTLL
nr:LINE-type retrotransposon LIb DNA [Ipomoea trifida]